MISNHTPSQMESAILAAVQGRIKTIIEEEIKKAVAEVERRIANEADQLALSLMSHYEITKMQDRIIIEVRKIGGAQ